MFRTIKIGSKYEKMKRVFCTICRSPQLSTTVFKNFKNQSQCFMTIFRNFKTNQRFVIIFGIKHQCKNVEILFRASSALEKELKNTRVVKIDKKRLKVVLVVLDAVKSKFSDTRVYWWYFKRWMRKRKNHCRWGNFFRSLEAKN